MVRLRIRCRCVALAIILSQVFIGFWYFSQPLDPARQFLRRLFTEGGQSILHLTDCPMSYYFEFYGKDLCVREGTIIKESSEGNCVCRSGWKGRRCGVPEVMQKTEWMQVPELSKTIQLRKKARRVIVVSPFFQEYDLFEANVLDLVGLVDVFIIGETNHTDVSSNNSLPILNKLKSGWLKKFQDRIIYVPVSENDMKKSSFVQNLVQTGLRLISDIRPDDLFILTSGEEILSRNVVLFLKLFQGYPLPVKCQYKNYLYGFFWSVPDNNNTKPKVCAASFQFLANAFEYQVSRLEEGNVLEEDLNFFMSHEQPVANWTIPDAGWRCHLCLSIKQIYQKLSNPLNQTKWLPLDSREGMLFFIQRLIKFGQDEDLDPVGIQTTVADKDLPPFFKKRKVKYASLLKNPYEIPSINHLFI